MYIQSKLLQNKERSSMYIINNNGDNISPCQARQTRQNSGGWWVAGVAKI